MLTKAATNNLFKYTLTFDDLLMVPKYSEIESRKEIDISCPASTLNLSLPIISSPMDTVTESEMAQIVAQHGGLGIVHRYCSIEEQIVMAKRSGAYPATDTLTAAAAIGVSGDYLDRATALYDAGVRTLCVDVAHGHHVLMKNALSELRAIFDDHITLIAGNVAMSDGYLDLSRWGADFVRVGIGGGSICSTRIQTGHGVPTLQSIMACHIARKMNRDTSFAPAAIIADGGIRNSGDIVKALAAGADCVMLGSMLAGTDESPGPVFQNNNGKKYKVYRGMASVEAQEEWRGFATSLEGVSTTIPYKGPASLILRDLESNIRSGFSYSGARNLYELREKCEFVIQTSAGQNESATHIMGKK